MPNIKIKIGAAVDPRIGDQIFQPIVAASKKARKAIRDGMAEAVSGGGNPYRTPALTRGRDPQVAIVKQRAKDLKEAHKEVERELKSHQIEQRKIAREMSRQDNRAQRIADSAALRVSGGAVRNMGAAVQRGVGVAGDLARGAGVDYSLGGALKSRLDLQKSATDISNSGYLTTAQGGKGANLQRQDPRDIMADAQKAAISTGNTTEDVMAGLSAFVAKTGDLATGRAILADMAKLATATGSNLGDVVSAAGDISSNLGDVKDKAQAVESIMRITAGQGKLGAVEMKDFSVQMAKVASRTGEYSGSTEDTMSSLGALVQVARAHGGAASASQAANSVGSFTNTFSKSARRKEFAAAGVQIEDEKGALLDPETIIRNSLKATKGDKNAMNKLFMDANAQRAVRGFQTEYNKAGGGEKGDEAVHKMFTEMRGAGMSKDQVNEQFGAAMGTGASKASVLQEKIKKDLGDALEKAAPNLMKLGEVAGQVITSFGGLVSWASDNPFKAVMGLMSASIMKSMGSEMMRSGIERMSGGLAGRMGVAGASNTVGTTSGGANAISNLGAAVAIFAAAVTAFSVGAEGIDRIFGKKDKADDAGNTLEADASNAIGRLKKIRAEIAAGGGPETPKQAEELAAAEEEVRRTGARVGEAREDGAAKGIVGPDWIASIGEAIKAATGIGDGGAANNAALANLERLPELSAKFDAMNALLGGELTVNVTNMPAGVGGVPAGGRTVDGDSALSILTGRNKTARNSYRLPVTLFDELQRASFGGVEFPTRDVSVHGGIRHKLHEYPHQPSAKIEKLGRKPYEIEMVVPFHNNLIGWPVLYPGGINSIRQLMEDEKTSDLLIPTIGTLPCVLVDITEKMSAKVRSGVEVTLKFVEDTLTTGLEVGVTSTAFVDLASQLADFTIAIEPVKPRPRLFDGITDLTNSISAIRGEVEMAANDVEGKILQCKMLIDTADRTLDVLRKPDEIAAPIIEAMRNLWESLDTFERNLQGTGVPLIAYVVPRDMTVSDISFDLYSDGTRGAQIMSLNPLRDPFAVRSGTQLNVYSE